MFMIVNTDHIHADLMVLEKDVYKVKKGQKCPLLWSLFRENTLTAKIYSVGKQFEQNPKAVHVHAGDRLKERFSDPGYVHHR